MRERSPFVWNHPVWAFLICMAASFVLVTAIVTAFGGQLPWVARRGPVAIQPKVASTETTTTREEVLDLSRCSAVYLEIPLEDGDSIRLGQHTLRFWKSPSELPKITCIVRVTKP